MAIISPEMSHRILDISHFRFHVECKAKIVNALNKLKAGGDFIKALGDLRFSTDKKWTKNSCNNPNVAILLEILEEYKAVEKRPNRARVLVPLFEYAIGLYASDLFYVERGEWLLSRICANADRFKFHRCFSEPENWYPNTRTDADPCVDDIEKEYRDWYDVDPTDDKSVISYDMNKVQDLIRRQREIHIRESNRKWAEQELAKI